MSNRPLFLFGAPRSGTKLLMNLLNNHPQIFLADEMNSFAYLLEKYAGANLKDTKNLKKLLNDVYQTKYYIKYKKNGTVVDSSYWDSDWQLNNIEHFLEIFIKIYAEKLKNKNNLKNIIWGNKSPHSTGKVDIFGKHYPESRFILILRDPRNCALSSNQVWKTNNLRYAQRWFDRINSAVRYLDSLESSRYIIIKYEDLIKAPKKILAKCLKLCGLTFESRYLQLGSPSEKYGYAKDKLEIIQQDSQKYEKFLSKNDIYKIEGITLPIIRRFNYYHKYNGKHIKISSVMMRCYQIFDIYNRLRFDIKEEGFKNFMTILKYKLAHFKN